jgi:recombination protein RecR
VAEAYEGAFMPPSLKALTAALARLPGIGPKTPSGLLFICFSTTVNLPAALGHALQQSLQGLQPCQRCNNFSEQPICPACEDSSRDGRLLCVVETPADLLVMEQTRSFRGRYFVLKGRLSPLDGMGPKQIGLPELLERSLDPELEELIIATNFTPEGEATAHAIETVLAAQDRSPSLRITRLARGVPLGGELEYVDLGTIAQAFRDRRGMT